MISPLHCVTADRMSDITREVMIVDNMKTGQFIKELRTEKKMTQKELAEQLHITDRAVSKWERGLCAPDIALLEPLAQILEVSITELLQGERAQRQEDNQLKEEYAQYVMEYFKNELGRKIKVFRRRFFSVLGICILVTIIISVSILWQKGYFFIIDRNESPDGKYIVTVYDKYIRDKGLFKEDGIFIVSEDTITGGKGNSFYGDYTYVDIDWSPDSEKFLLQLENENEQRLLLHWEEQNSTSDLSAYLYGAVENSKLSEKSGYGNIKYRFLYWDNAEEMIFEYSFDDEEGKLSYNCVTGKLNLLPKGTASCTGTLWHLNLTSNMNDEIVTGSSLGINTVYTFKKAAPQNLPKSRWKIRGLYENDHEKKNSLFVGQVITLFGEADDIAQDSENMCSWAVCAEDKSGHKIYLEIYYGLSGPAIGGNDAEGYEAAADELAELIMSAKPADFQFESTYEDIPETICMEVLDGWPSYEMRLEEDAS